jgi:hypothetical protein
MAKGNPAEPAAQAEAPGLPGIAVLRDAFVAGQPPSVNPDERLWQGGGLYDAEGRAAELVAGMMGPPGRLPGGRRRRAGALEAALFCGRFRAHFGHLLAESVGRIWAVDRLGPDLPLIWFAHPRDAGSNLRLLRTLLSLLSVENPVLVAEEALRVGTLHVPPTLCDALFGVPADPAFQDWLASRLPPPAEGAPDLYVSRVRLPDRAGRFLGEEAIEAGLAAEGYQVIYPEALPLDRQVALYRGARRVVLAEGSPVHLLALLDVPGQEIAMLRRRPRVVRSMPATFASFRRARAHTIDRVGRCWGSTPSPRILFRAVSEIDIAAVWDDLAALGFVGPGAQPVPDADALAAERLRRAPDRPVLLPLP